MALCLGAGLLAAKLAANAFTLAWTHSIEKIHRMPANTRCACMASAVR